MKKLKLHITGMHCASCEVRIERKFREIPGIQKVSVNAATGRAKIWCDLEPDLGVLNAAIRDDGYSVANWQDADSVLPTPRERNVVETGGIFLLLLGLYLLFRRFDLVSAFGMTDDMSYGLAFSMGLVAAISSCMAVTGGLLVALSAKFNERHPGLTGVQKLKPLLSFNIGRVLSYTFFGAALGLLGSVVTLSTRATGILTILVSLVMILLGFQMLKVFPWLKHFQPKMPKFIAHRVHDFGNRGTAPMLIGAATFFLPCGFTQALQLYVLSQGSPAVGAFTMLFFSLGTLPGLLSLSAISSFAQGAFQRYFLKFAGVMIVMIGIVSMSNGLALAGVDLSLSSLFSKNGQAVGAVTMVDGKQIVEMKVDGYEYSPANFTVKKGIPVEWKIDGRKAAGCAKVITAPSIDMTKMLSSSEITTIAFTPQESGTIPFSCSMGMTTPGAAFRVM